MSKSACKCKAAECEECPEWIFTFADLVMLMMGFFVILWVLKPPAGEPKTETQVKQQDEWLQTVGEIRGGFGWEPNPKSEDPVDQVTIKRRLMNGPGDAGRAERPANGATGTEPEVTSVRPGKYAIVGTRVLFEAGKTELTAEATKGIEDIAKKILGLRHIVIVKGHAGMDDFGDDATPDERMKLSVDRAQAVANYLMRHGVSADTLRVQGCSVFEPVLARAYTPTARLQNRRVEVEATDNAVEDRQDAPHSPAASESPDAAKKTIE